MSAKTNILLSVLGCGAIVSPSNDKADNMFLMKCSQQLKEWTGKPTVRSSTTAKSTRSLTTGCSLRSGANPLCSVRGFDNRRFLWRVLQRRCDGAREGLLRPEPLCVLVRVARAVQDAAKVPVNESAKSRTLISFVKTSWTAFSGLTFPATLVQPGQRSVNMNVRRDE